MREYYCDKCGKQVAYDEYLKGIYEEGFLLSESKRLFELCKECRELLKKWVDQE